MSESKPHIVASLRELSWLLSLRNEDFFRSRAYAKAADAVARYDGDLGALIDAGRVSELAGVGKRSASIVGELHQTGRCHLLSDLRKQFPREVGRLARIPGLGLARLQALHQGLGIETIQELRAATASGALEGVKGFGPSLIAKIRKALDAVDGAHRRLLLPEARQLAAALVDLWSPRLTTTLETTGALRRREAAIDRLELLGAGVRPELPELPRVGSLTPVGPHPLRPDLDGWAGDLHEGVPVTLWLAPPATLGAAMVATTGPTVFAERALASAEVLDDEAALLASSGLEAWAPEARHLCAPGIAAPRLVERAQLRGMVHVHTTDSDGRDDLRTLAREAKTLGYDYLTVTDHSPSARYARGLDLKALAEQGERIRAVEQEVGVRILRGTESDIHPEGGLDHPIEVLRDLDVVIASLHGGFRLDADRMTARLLKTFALPVRMIWGHPLGRLVLTRAPIEADLDRVLDLIAERGHIIEVNGDPHRMDLPPPWIVEAKKRGIPLVLSADAHSVRGLRMAETAVDNARAGGVEPQDVLNTLDADAFRAAVGPAG